MPELPEVETLRRELARVLVGKKIKGAEVFWPKMVKPLSIPTFCKKIAGQKIKSVDRHAKMILIDFVGPLSLAIHLKMTGQLIYQPKTGRLIAGGHPEDPGKYLRIIFHFTDGTKLLFNDLRKFGWARLVDDKGVRDLLEPVGVEPLARDFTIEKLSEFIKRYPGRSIKQILLDQKLIAGIGNIYADESCFLAKILPDRKAAKISPTEIKKLHQAIISVLKLSISKKGTSARNYVRSDGSRGGFVPYLNVYGRASELCKACKTPIKKNRHAGRGTHFCQKCQK